MELLVLKYVLMDSMEMKQQDNVLFVIVHVVLVTDHQELNVLHAAMVDGNQEAHVLQHAQMELTQKIAQWLVMIVTILVILAPVQSLIVVWHVKPHIIFPEQNVLQLAQPDITETQ